MSRFTQLTGLVAAEGMLELYVLNKSGAGFEYAADRSTIRFANDPRNATLGLIVLLASSAS